MDNNKEFKANVQSLLKIYNKSEIDEEALADVSGQLFGNQEYINNIAQTKPNVFKRIYNEIKYLYHQLYAKKFLKQNKNLTQKIKKELPTSSTSNNGRSSRMTTTTCNIQQNENNVNNFTKYSIVNL